MRVVTWLEYRAFVVPLCRFLQPGHSSEPSAWRWLQAALALPFICHLCSVVAGPSLVRGTGSPVLLMRTSSLLCVFCLYNTQLFSWASPATCSGWWSSTPCVQGRAHARRLTVVRWTTLALRRSSAVLERVDPPGHYMAESGQSSIHNFSE